MRNRKQCFALLLVFCMVISMLSGCEKKTDQTSLNADQSTGTETAGSNQGSKEEVPGLDPALSLTGIVKEPADGIGEAGKDFVLPKTGAADDWQDTPIPKFNPLGSLSLYSSVEYKGVDSEETIFYSLDGYTEKQVGVIGERWELKVATPDYSTYWLRWYTRESGGQWFSGTREHSTFTLPEGDTVTWWADARQTPEGVEITVIKANTLPIGKSITLHPKEIAGEYYTFYTSPTNGKLQSAAITLKGANDSGVSLDVSSMVKQGLYTHNTLLSIEKENLNLKKTNRFVLDDLPIADGPLCWRIGWGEDVPVPDEVVIQLDTVADIAPVKWGETPGAIRVTGIPMGEARVFTPDWATISHPEVAVAEKELSGMTDQNGDMVFAAPPGYYQVMIASGAGSDQNFLRLIPVNAGEITTVTIPPEAKAAAGALSRQYGDFNTNEGGIELLNNNAAGDSGTVSFVLNDPKERDVFPENKDIKITEDGMEAVITKIEREPAGSDVVLVLDSSGSMGENMKPCVIAAKRFVESLPQNSSIRLIQFSQQVTVYPDEGKEAVLKTLDTVKEGGATSLYDATGKALELLKDKKRGYAVVFSDGADSREPDVDGTGSTTTKEQIIQQIKDSGVTVLTIGFGKGHDPSTLIAMSGASKNGGYFAAADKNALDGAFASVAGKFGNQFTVTYQRPTLPNDQNGTVPVVSLMLDRSGSMDSEPNQSENTGWRMDRMKEIFHNFVLKLPDKTLMQMGSFAEPEGGEEPRFDQITTDQKANLLQAIGSMQAGGGTPTKLALSLAYQNLAPIPSQKRVLVFFTDAALYNPENPEELDEVLSKLKESGIRVLFAGLSDDSGSTELDTIFRTAAQKAGGDYILTNQMEDIAKKLDELLARIDTPVPKQGIDFTLGVDCKTDNGGRMNFYTATNLPAFTPKMGSSKKVDPQVVTCKTGEPYTIYNHDAAALLYGGDQPMTQSNVLLRLPFHEKQGSNQFGKLTVSEAYLLDVFKGIPAPSGQVYLALNTTLEFAKAEKNKKETGYSIPNIFNHFYVSVNEGRMMPASKATWLAEKPFAMPGENEVTVTDKEPRTGALVFLIDQPDKNNITQLSLHLYDTQNGHIELPLAGRLTKQMLAMDALPTEAPAEMSKTFSLAVTGKTDQTALEGVTLNQADANSAPEEAKKNTSFRVLEAKFDSKVQALLDIDPTERFLYQIETDKGVLLTPMSDIVHNLPLGFVGSTLLAPGSCNNVRLPFILPNELLGTKASLYADLATGSKLFSVANGEVYNTGGDGITFSHQYFNFTINSLSLYSEGSHQVVLDFTLSDKKDGEGTGGVDSILQLQRGEDNSSKEAQLIMTGRKGLADFSGNNENVITVSQADTEPLLFGGLTESGSWGAFDGQSRRGILVFALPDGAPVTEWTLTSSLLPDMKVPVRDSVYPNRALLAEKPKITVDTDFEKKLDDAVNGAIAAYLATRPEPVTKNLVGLSDDEVLGKQVSSPALTLYGSQRMKLVQSDTDFIKLMRELRWIPSVVGEESKYRYAPEAVLTQGWGGQYDLAVLAKTLLARLGYSPEYRTVTMTATGQENLRRISSVEEVPQKLIGIAYTDSAGIQKIFLPVFSADLSELGGLAYLSSDETQVSIVPAMGHLTIELYGKLTGRAADLMSSNAELWDALGASLSGEEGGNDYHETIPLLDKELSLPELSLDSLDISYLSKPKSDGGTLILPVLDTRQGLIYDPNAWVDTSFYEFERLTIRLQDGDNTAAVHMTMLTKEQKLSEICHTLGWGVPELTEEAAKSIETMVKAEAEATKEPANYSISRWLGHATISRLVKGLSDASRTHAKTLDLVAGRSDKAIALIVTMKSDGKTAEATVDLMDHRNQLHNGDDSARHAYNLMYGYFASDMEALALPGNEGFGYTKVWESLPEGTKIRPFAIEDSTSLEQATEQLSQDKYPPLLLERMRGGDNPDPPLVLYLVPDQPAEINGKPRWAWLEIDLTSYDVVSVFETGERAGMGEYLIGCLPGNGNYGEVGAGALVGITTAVGSVAAYTLGGSDYETTMKQAAAKCEEIGAIMGVVTGVTGAIDTGGKINEGISDVTEIHWEKLFEANEGIFVNKLTFCDGYQFAVEAYFKTR